MKTELKGSDCVVTAVTAGCLLFAEPFIGISNTDWSIMCYHFTLPFLHLSLGEWLIMCSRFTLPSLDLSHGEWLLICCHFTLPSLPISHGEWLIMCFHFTLPSFDLSHGEWLLMHCHSTLPFLHLSHGAWPIIVPLSHHSQWSLHPLFGPVWPALCVQSLMSLSWQINITPLGHVNRDVQSDLTVGCGNWIYLLYHANKRATQLILKESISTLPPSTLHLRAVIYSVVRIASIQGCWLSCEVLWKSVGTSP
jgi:hypothetical protein